MGKVVTLDVSINEFNAPYEPIRQALASLPCKDTVQICIAVHRTMTRLLSMNKDTDAIYFADSEKLANAIGACYVYDVQGVPLKSEVMKNDTGTGKQHRKQCVSNKAKQV